MTGAYSNLKGIKIKNKYAMSFHFLIVWLATSETQYVYICFILVKQMIACTLFLQFFTAAKNEKYFIKAYIFVIDKGLTIKFIFF